MGTINKKIIAFVIGICVGLGLFYLWTLKSNTVIQIDANAYYAVFINNGQVYFGHFTDRTDSEFVFTDVYYLQSEKGESQVSITEPKFTLIKMGNEIHGPTDSLYINKDNVLFYEKLREDSKVVKSILENKQK